ncbi:hypothetical protein DL546_003476 [Coniochaeta pulveracea]|uniref:DNA mismatch repair protein S5 domain-containing protein n=1 Tax=Coniochaeta pulveracea TaxID=177199 RepID=A0A420Y4V6_9PEZI|nr:hypothetical protein DL546_003476 [Coniochaeta pulveracea]
MPISALPAETVRLLGSSVVYTSPVSFVKELVDNAIDAQATSIEIFLSPNTTDLVEVRDNGHGIHPKDFNLIGHRGHTSKLRKFQDLHTVGPITLGFRGDALASAAIMSTLIIITRVVGEPTASRLHMSERGGVKMVERVAGPVGTAVKATQLFENLPVRKQWAIKEAAKTISQIRQLQHTYFFARPYMRISFKVLGNPKSSWSYAPGARPSMKEAALQIFGADLVSHCVERTMSFAASDDDEAAVASCDTLKSDEQSHYTFEAFLPKPGADPVKISKWAFISVDSRPVSHAKGFLKTLYLSFKDRLRRNLEQTEARLPIINPFLALNIKCPPASYDPNIEPSKDEVLFVNAHRLVIIFEQFLENVYSGPTAASGAITYQDEGLHLPSPPASNSNTWSHEEWRSKGSARPHACRLATMEGKGLEDGGRIRLSGAEYGAHARHHGETTSRTLEATALGEIATAALAAQEDIQAYAMKAPHNTGDIPLGQRDNCDDRIRDSQSQKSGAAHDEDAHGGRAQVRTLDHAQCRQDITPWTIAKAHRFSHNEALSGSKDPGKAEPTVHDGTLQRNFEESRLAFLERLADLPESNGGARRQRDRRPSPVRAKRFGKLPANTFRSPVTKETDNWAFGPKTRSKMSRTGQSHRSLAASAQNDDEYQPGGSGQRRLSRRTKPNEDLVQTTLEFSSRNHGKRALNSPIVVQQGSASRRWRAEAATEGPELETIDLSAIRRRQIVAENRTVRDSQDRQTAMQLEPAQTTRLPQSAQPLHEASALEQSDSLRSDGLSKSSLPSGDPRAYLMRRSCSMPATTPRKLRRLNSCVLPLETTPAGYELYNLTQTMPLELWQFVPREESAVGYGLHVIDISGDGLDNCITRAEFQKIQQQVKVLLGKLDPTLSDKLGDIEFISSHKLLGKSKAH